MKNILVILMFLMTLTAGLASPHQNNSDLDSILYEIVQLRPKADTSVFSHIRNWYSLTGENPVWSDTTMKTGLAILNNSKIHGLNPNDYLADRLSERLNATTADQFSDRYERLSTDVMMSFGILNFTHHILEGKINPLNFFGTWNYQKNLFNNEIAQELFSAILRDKLEDFIRKTVPTNQYYSALYHWMERYYNGEFDQEEMLKLDSMPLKSGYRGPEIKEIKYKLRQFDSYSGDIPSDEFDPVLEKAITSFQKMMGLKADGVIGRQTLAALNMTADEKRDMVRVNMERARWLFHEFPRELLLVNIAGFEMYYFRNTEAIFQTPVIVGKVHHETPVFYANLKYIELNCVWTVPRSIAVEEILPIVKKDSNYLQSHQFEVLQGQNKIDPSTIDWTDYSSNNFPFTFRQLPGPYNPLGKVKFIFPNEYMVYLHDTPAKHLFEEEGSRAFSHGCVRVKNPLRLAQMILERQGISSADIDSLLKTNKTHQLDVATPLPVFLVYWTVFPSFQGDQDKLNWVKDIYGRDEQILRALDQ